MLVIPNDLECHVHLYVDLFLCGTGQVRPTQAHSIMLVYLISGDEG